MAPYKQRPQNLLEMLKFVEKQRLNILFHAIYFAIFDEFLYFHSAFDALFHFEKLSNVGKFFREKLKTKSWSTWEIFQSPKTRISGTIYLCPITGTHHYI